MSQRRILTSGLVVAAVILILAGPAWAQGVGGIGGTVTDSSGAVLPGVTLTLSERSGRHAGWQPGDHERWAG